MPTVTRNDLKLGDILMTKSEWNATHTMISIGSFFAGNFSTANYVHPQIVCKVDPSIICESHGAGLTTDPPTTAATVFRLKGSGGKLTPVFAKICAERAAEVANELQGRQQPNEAFGTYAYGNALASLVTKTTVTEAVSVKLKGIDEGTVQAKFFCSMFVITCYQVAMLRLARSGFAPPARLLPFQLDADAMEPAYMVSYLRRNPDYWTELGEFAGGQP
jgi:hypothetical protein